MQFDKHPLYRDPALVRHTTEQLIDSGNTVFQLFQFAGGERLHSIRVLESLALPVNAQVLSLGCGVAGMEAVWADVRPDLVFELVNKSADQLDLAVCPGRKVCADAEGYKSENGPFDCVVLAYMLGHVDVAATLRNAFANLKRGGKLIVLDVFNSSDLFNETLAYKSPLIEAVETVADEYAGFRSFMYGCFDPCEHAQALPEDLLAQTTPAMFIAEAA